MRVLFTTKAGAGHFGPLIPFAHAFRRAGAEVLIAAPREAAAMVRAEGLPLWAFDDPPAGERDAIFASVRHESDEAAHGRVAGDILRASTRAPPTPVSSPHAGPGGPTSSSARSPSSPARSRRRRSAFPPSASASRSRARRSA
jgi:hypothetical protein